MFFRRPYYADAAPQGGLDDLTRHSDVTKLACHSLPQKDRAKASLYACYLAINLQNFGGSDVERARRRTWAGSSSKVEIAERLTVVVADDEASIVVLIDRPGRGKARYGANPSSSAFASFRSSVSKPPVNQP